MSGTTTAPTPVPSSVAPRPLRGRALLAVALLLGWYVLGFGTLALLAVLNLAAVLADQINVRLILLSLFLGFGLIRGLFFSGRADPIDQAGIAVDARSQPALLSVVDAVALRLGQRSPDLVLLVPDVNAFVASEDRLLGLRPGRRVLGIGVPLVDVLRVDELAAVLAHEFGHLSSGDTRLGGLVYRGRSSISRTVSAIGGTLVGLVFVGYAKLYLRVSLAVSRRQELAADANAARLFGPDVHERALREVDVAGAAFAHFLAAYAVPLWQQQRTPADLYGGFRSYRSDPARARELEELRARTDPAPSDPYDSHPSLSERVALLRALPPGREVVPDRRPARELLADPAVTEAQVAAVVERAASPSQRLVPVPWEEAGPLVLGRTDQQVALIDGLAAQLGRPERGLRGALALVAAGRGPELGAALTRALGGVAPEGDRPLLARELGLAVGAGLVARGDHRWVLTWGPSAAVESRDGRVTDLATLVDRTFDDPALAGHLAACLPPP